LLAPEIGFTGTQEGMSEKQRSSLRQVLAGFFADGARVFRHLGGGAGVSVLRCFGVTGEYHGQPR
jgi:hypothetical protein